MAVIKSLFHSISSRLLPAFLLAALIPTIMLTFTTFYAVKNVAISSTSQRIEEQFSLISSFLEDMIVSTAMELSVIKGHQSFSSYLINNTELNVVKADFEGAMVRHPEFLQLRYIDRTGHEILRINRKDNALKWVTAEELQDKSNYYYFKQAMGISLDEIYVSDLDLNVEHNEIEVPWRLVARVGVKVYQNDELNGLLLVNIDGNHILEKILPFAGNRADKAFLMNNHGQYIGFNGEAFSVSPPEMLKTKFGLTNETIFNAEPETLIKTDSGFISVMPVAFYQQNSGNIWRVVLSIPNSEIYGSLMDALKVFMTALLIILTIAAAFSLTVSGSIIRYIKRIVRFIPHAADKPFAETGIQEFDEIGVEIHNMAVGLRKSTEDLAELNSSLEERIRDNIEQISRMAKKQLSYEKELRDIQTQLMQADRLASLGLISATVAHEIGNPLAAMKTSLQVLQMDVKDETDKEFIGKIVSQVDKLSDFLRSITKFGGRKQAVNKDININSVLTEVHDFLKAELKKKSIKFRISDKGSYTLNCDETELRQVLFNIVINSIQELDGIGEITAETSVTDGTPMIHIYDTGRGVEDAEKLFSPFYTTKSDGTGLGLAIVRNIVKDNGWELKAANVDGAGLGISILFKGKIK
jgi:signal transduction histidine kinase